VEAKEPVNPSVAVAAFLSPATATDRKVRRNPTVAPPCYRRAERTTSIIKVCLTGLSGSGSGDGWCGDFQVAFAVLPSPPAFTLA
jgi:hypothetical protein